MTDEIKNMEALIMTELTCRVHKDIMYILNEIRYATHYLRCISIEIDYILDDVFALEDECNKESIKNISPSYKEISKKYSFLQDIMGDYDMGMTQLANDLSELLEKMPKGTLDECKTMPTELKLKVIK